VNEQAKVEAITIDTEDGTSRIPTAEELHKAILGPVVRVPDIVIDALNAIREAGIALESRIDVLEATCSAWSGSISESTERDILYAMIEDNGKELSGMSQQLHGLRVQLQRMGETLNGYFKGAEGRLTG